VLGPPRPDRRFRHPREVRGVEAADRPRGDDAARAGAVGLDLQLLVRRAARLEPQDPAAHYSAAQASAILGQGDAALRYLERAFELDSSYAREASADEKLILLQGDEEFMRLLREAGSHAR